MSAQGGIWNFEKRPVSRTLVAQLSDALARSGPDGESSYIQGEIALLYHPYHTTSDSLCEHQPYISEDGCILTWDGRLDNRDDLLSALHLGRQNRCADVDVAAAAFAHWGSDAFGKLVGDWAVSIWNPRRRELMFATDYLSVRHIFYHLSPGSICWSSELGALVNLSARAFTLSDEFVAGYFANEPDAHLTPYEEIRQVTAGHFVRVQEHGNIKLVRYWSVEPGLRIRYKSDSEYEEHFRHLLRKSVARRLRCQVAVLAEFSGGFDSSSIVCMADDIVAREGSQCPQVETLSYESTREPNADDAKYRKIIEQSRGRVGAYIEVTDAESTVRWDEYPSYLALPGYLPFNQKIEAERARIVSEGGYRVVLSGVGGDEFMGGIPDTSAQLADLILQFRFGTFMRELGRWSLATRRPALSLLTAALLELAPQWFSQRFLTQAKAETWISPQFAKRMKIGEHQVSVSEHFGLWLRSRRFYAGGVLLMANKLAKWKPASVGLEETRFPFLDRDLIEFVLAIPANQLNRPGERRSLMKRSLQGILPSALLSRKTKQLGSRRPIVALEKNWESLSSLAQHFCTADLGYIDLPKFVTALNLARNGQRIHIPRLLRGLSLELWLRSMIDRGVFQPPRFFRAVGRPRSQQLLATQQIRVLHRS